MRARAAILTALPALAAFAACGQELETSLTSSGSPDAGAAHDAAGATDGATDTTPTDSGSDAALADASIADAGADADADATTDPVRCTTFNETFSSGTAWNRDDQGWFPPPSAPYFETSSMVGRFQASTHTTPLPTSFLVHGLTPNCDAKLKATLRISDEVANVVDVTLVRIATSGPPIDLVRRAGGVFVARYAGGDHTISQMNTGVSYTVDVFVPAAGGDITTLLSGVPPSAGQKLHIDGAIHVTQLQIGIVEAKFANTASNVTYTVDADDIQLDNP